MVSTSNNPDGLFSKIENEKDGLCIYKRLVMPYQVSLHKLFSEQEIDNARLTPGFRREFECIYEGLIGNVFNPFDISFITNDKYSLDPSYTTSHIYTRFMGIDSGYGSSEFGITIAQWKDSKLEVLYSDSFEIKLCPDAVKLIQELITQYHVCKVFIDGSDSALCKHLKHSYGEMINYHLLKIEDLDSFISSPCHAPLICPITFHRHHLDMLKRTHRIIAGHHIRIDPSFNKLITSLRTAVTKEWNLQKDKMSYSDCLDSLSLSVMSQRFKGELN